MSAPVPAGPGAVPRVLFACVQNAGRSQLAAALFDHHAAGRAVAISAGSRPAERLHPEVVAALAEVGIDVGSRRPAVLTDDAVRASDAVVTMGCDESCPVYPGRRYVSWELADPAGRPLDEVRTIRDEIDRRVRVLVAELLAGIVIRPMTPVDAADVLDIYRAGIETGNATFETGVPDWNAWDKDHLPEHRLVAVDAADRALLGWVAVGPVSGRCVYGGVVENSVYVRPDARGRGIGLALLEALIASTEAAGVWTIQTGIFPENEASVAIHERVGFRVVGRRERIGRHFGRWRDVLLMERRSPRVE